MTMTKPDLIKLFKSSIEVGLEEAAAIYDPVVGELPPRALFDAQAVDITAGLLCPDLATQALSRLISGASLARLVRIRVPGSIAVTDGFFIRLLSPLIMARLREAKDIADRRVNFRPRRGERRVKFHVAIDVVFPTSAHCEALLSNLRAQAKDAAANIPDACALVVRGVLNMELEGGELLRTGRIIMHSFDNVPDEIQTKLTKEIIGDICTYCSFVDEIETNDAMWAREASAPRFSDEIIREAGRGPTGGEKKEQEGEEGPVAEAIEAVEEDDLDRTVPLPVGA